MDKELDEATFYKILRTTLKNYEMGINKIYELVNEIQFYEKRGYRIKYYLKGDNLAFKPIKKDLGFKVKEIEDKNFLV